MVLLDRVNLALVELLQQNGRISLSEMARRVRRAETTVRERLAALEAGGLIRGYRATIDAERLGFKVRAYVNCDVEMSTLAGLGEKLHAIPQVVNAALTSGPRPLLLEIVAKDMDHLSRIMEQRLSLLGLRSMEVHVLLKEFVGHRPAPVPVPSILAPSEGTRFGQEPVLEDEEVLAQTAMRPQL